MSAALLARLLFSVVTAVIGSVYLARVLKSTGNSDDTETGDPSIESRRTAQWLRTIVLTGYAVWAVVWLAIALVRLRYPFELEWAGGSMRDHCERVLIGKPLYAAPTSEWFPFEYPPLYFWVCSALMRLFHDPSFVPMRMVSIGSTIGCAVLIGAWVRQAVGVANGRFWSWVAPGIFLASYRFTGAWYDIERLDMLFLFLSLAGGYFLVCSMRASPESPDKSGQISQTTFVLLSAIAYWLAFLTKQQAVLYITGSLAAFAISRRRRDLGLFAILSALLCFGSVVALNRSTAGWFSFYCFRVPMANGIKLNLAAQYFTIDLPLYAPLIGLIAVALLLRCTPEKSRNAAGAAINRESMWMLPEWSWCLMGLAGSLLSRAHWGGDQNVLMAGFIGLILVGCTFAGRLTSLTGRAESALCLIALAQMIVLVYRPDAQVPRAVNRNAGERYAAAVRRLEIEGEVLCLDHGGMSAVPHFHLMAVLDVAGLEKRLPITIQTAIRNHQYAAILTDAKPDSNGLFGDLNRYYRAEESLHIDSSWTVTGFPTPSPGREVWVLKPRIQVPR